MAVKRTSTRQDTASLLPIATVAVGVGIDQLQKHVDESVVQWALLRMEIGGGDFSRIKLVALTSNSDEIRAVSRSRQSMRTPKVLQKFGDVNATIEVHRVAEITHKQIEERVRHIFSGDHLNVDLSRSVSKDPTMTRAYTEKPSRGRDPASLLVNVQEEPAAQAHMSNNVSDGAAIGRSLPSRQPTNMTASEALRLVAGDDENCNWALLEPEKMSLHSHGRDGMEEMKSCLPEDQVLYGLLRLAMPLQQCEDMDMCKKKSGNRRLSEDTGGKARRLTKHVFVHWVGPRVGAVKRGLHIGKRSDAEIEVRKFCAYALAVTAHRKQDLVLEDCVSELQRLTVLEVGTGSHRSSGKGAESKPVESPTLAPSPREADEKSGQATRERKISGDESVGSAGDDGGLSRKMTEEEMLPDPDVAIEVVRTGNGAWEWVLLGPVQKLNSV